MMKIHHDRLVVRTLVDAARSARRGADERAPNPRVT